MVVGTLNGSVQKILSRCKHEGTKFTVSARKGNLVVEMEVEVFAQGMLCALFLTVRFLPVVSIPLTKYNRLLPDFFLMHG